jgi:hypothetical protein
VAQTSDQGVVALTPVEMKWASQGGLAAPGMEQLNLVGDPAKPGPYTLRLKFPKGFKIAPHTHPDSREVTILSGTFATGYGEKFDVANLKILPAGSSTPNPQTSPLHRDQGRCRPASKWHGPELTQICQSARNRISGFDGAEVEIEIVRMSGHGRHECDVWQRPV